MAETVPGGIYKGINGQYHDAEGNLIPAEQAEKLLAELALIKDPTLAATLPTPQPEASSEVPVEAEPEVPVRRTRKAA